MNATAGESADRQAVGKTGEAMAAWYLEACGYRIVERNYRSPLGEIDIIARDRGVLAFVEVKARRSGRYGDPKYALTAKKKDHLARVALWYLKETGQLGEPARFDVVAIRYRGAAPSIELVKSAFEVRV